MATLSIRPYVNVKQCSLCQGDTEYHCRTCTQNMCPPCKKTHTLSLDTKDHDVTLYREKFTSCYNLEMCVKHPNQVYEMYCESCNLPVCVLCEQHRHHKLQNIRTVYEDKRKQNEKDLINIRSDIIYNAHVMLAEIKCDMSTCKKELVFNHLKTILEKSQNLQHAMDTVPNELCVKYKLLLISRAFKQIEKMKRHIRSIHIYEQRFEQCANRPVQFLRFITTVHIPNVQTTPHLTKQAIFSLTHNIYVEDLIKLLSQIQIKEKRKRQVENKLLLKYMSFPSLEHLIDLGDIDFCGHISCVTPYTVLFNDSQKFFLLETHRYSIDSIYRVFYEPGLQSEDLICGLHTVNKDGDLIFVHMNNAIIKFTIDGEQTLLKNKDYEREWKSQCVYCSQSSGDLLVGNISRHTHTGKVTRYNNRNQITQTIRGTFRHSKIYDPRFITENNNGDVIVSDWNRAVVVTSREGIYRFSYAGPPSGLPLRPQGICTDAFSQILVCDLSTNTVQMISKDGQFLSYLLIRKNSRSPRYLSYDINRHVLWVGHGKTCKLSVYRYIDRHLSLADTTEKQDDSSSRRESGKQSLSGYSQEEYDLITAKEEAADNVLKATLLALSIEELAKKTPGYTTEPSTESEENGYVELTSAEDENLSTEEKTYVLTEETIDKIAENIYKACRILKADAIIQIIKKKAEKAADIAETATTIAEAKAAANYAGKAFETIKTEAENLCKILR